MFLFNIVNYYNIYIYFSHYYYNNNMYNGGGFRGDGWKPLTIVLLFILRGFNVVDS